MTTAHLSGAGPAALCEGLRVVEVAGDPGGEQTGKLLAQYGADVVKVEPSAGSPTRRIGPWSGGHDDVNSSLTFWYYNTSKSSVVLDLPAAALSLERLLSEAD